MKFLVDMNLSPLWVAFLAEKGFAAAHWSTIGEPSAPDSEIFDFAAAHDWIVFTHDLDFSSLLVPWGRSGLASFKSAPKMSCRRQLVTW